MKGPFTKRLLLGLGLGAALGSCQPMQYTTKEEGLAALQAFQAREASSPVYQPQPSFSHGPYVAPFFLTAAVATSSSPSENPYARLTAKDYELKPLESPSKQPASLETVLTLPYVPVYSTALPPVPFEPYLLTERRERRLDRAYFPSQDQERFALDEGWFVFNARLRDNRYRDSIDEQSLPLGKLGTFARKLLEGSKHPLGQTLKKFSRIADGPTRTLLGNNGLTTNFNVRLATERAGFEYSIRLHKTAIPILEKSKITIGYQTSADMGGDKRGDSALFLTVEHTIGPREQ